MTATLQLQNPISNIGSLLERSTEADIDSFLNPELSPGFGESGDSHFRRVKGDEKGAPIATCFAGVCLAPESSRLRANLALIATHRTTRSQSSAYRPVGACLLATTR